MFSYLQPHTYFGFPTPGSQPIKVPDRKKEAVAKASEQHRVALQSDGGHRQDQTAAALHEALRQTRG